MLVWLFIVILTALLTIMSFFDPFSKRPDKGAIGSVEEKLVIRLQTSKNKIGGARGQTKKMISGIRKKVVKIVGRVRG